MRAILLREEQIKSLICQREPVILIDTFFKPADPEYYTGLKILPDNMANFGQHTELHNGILTMSELLRLWQLN